LQYYGPEGDNQEFFDAELKVWSQRKLRILEGYMAAWVKKRGFGHSSLFYVDGFAGRGRYGTTEPFQEGSPLKIAKLAQQIDVENRKYRLHCLNSEIDDVRCAHLKEVLSFANPQLVTTYCGAFSTHVETMIQKMRMSRPLLPRSLRDYWHCT